MASRIKFNSAAFRSILVGGGTQACVEGVVSGVAAGVPNARTSTIIGGFGGGRVVGFVSTNARNARELNEQREALEAAAHGA